MITDTKQKILAYIKTYHQARAHDLVGVFNLSQVAIHKQLNNLLKEGQLLKVGLHEVQHLPVATTPV